MQSFKENCINKYNEGQPIITDIEFDLTFGDLNYHDTQDTLSYNQINLPVWMGSLNKVRNDHQLNIWACKYKDIPLELTAKLDGVSGLLGPQTSFLYLRGNGKIGQDVSKIIPYLDLPKVPYLVRGEIIIPRNIFNEHYKSYKNPRNFVAGLLHQKNPDYVNLQRLHFIAYEVINEFSNDLDFISTLERDKFKVPIRKSLRDHRELVPFDKLYHSLDLTDYLYEIDGIVLRAQIPCKRATHGNPKNIIALKLDNISDTAITEVINISWKVSKWSLLFPVVHLNPKYLSGVTISNVTGNNATYVRNNQIGPGAVVKITRSGGVIPKIIKVLKPAANEFYGPDVPYKWEGVHIKKISSSDDVEVLQAKLLNILKGLNIKHLKLKGVNKLLTGNSKVQSFIDILKLIKNDKFIQVSKETGISPVIALKVQNQIQNLLFNQGINPIELISHIGIFGPNVNYKRLQSIINVIPTFLETNKIDLNKIREVKGINKLADVIYERYLEAYKLIQEFIKLEVKFHSSEKDPLHMNIVYSGFRDLGVPNDIKPSSRVTLKTDFLIVKDYTFTSIKVTRARELGIKIISRADFLIRFNDQSRLKINL